VYATLTAAVLLSALGVFFNITFHVGGVLATLAAFGSLTWLAFTPRTPDNQVRSLLGFHGPKAPCVYLSTPQHPAL
jgi:hypothetical protein